MRVLRIGIPAFGPLAGVEAGRKDPLPGLVAVLGPNESGKSAFHQALFSLLFGFYPASRESNPHTPWAGGDAEIQGTLAVEDGQALWEVKRRLLSAPRGELVAGGRVVDLANRTLPCATHVERTLYPQIYAITLTELAPLGSGGWGAIQDQLVVGMGSRDLRPPREVAGELREAADRLWRRDRRGRPRHRALRRERAELQERLREAEDRDRQHRGMAARRREIEGELGALEEDRAALAGRIQDLKELRPLRERLLHLDELRARAGDPGELRPLPRDPASRLEGWDDRLRDIRRRLDDLEARRKGVRERIEAVSESDRRLRARTGPLRALADRATLLQERAAQRERLSQELRTMERRLREIVAPLLEASPSEGEALRDALDPFLSLPLEDLKAALRDLEGRRRAREALEERLERTRKEAARDAPPGLVPLWTLPTGGLGLAILILGAVRGEALVAVSGAGLLALSAGAVAWRWALRSVASRDRRRHTDEVSRLRDELSRTAEGEEEARAAAEKLLSPLGVRHGLTGTASGDLPTRLERIREAIRDRDERAALLTGMEAEDRKLLVELDGVRRDLDVDLPTDPLLALPELGRRIRAAEERVSRGEEAAREEARVREDLDRVRIEGERLSEERTELRRSLEAAGGSDGPDGLALVEERLRSRELAERLTADLEREAGDLAALRKRIRETEPEREAWEDAPRRIAREEARLEEMEERIRGLREERAGLRARGRSLEAKDTPDLVAGRILEVEEELRNVERRRDRLFLLARTLEVAEHRFREAHQPDLLRRAEKHLRSITGGRYDRLLLGEGGDEERFRLQAEHLPGTLPVAPPLSTGTREQVYLALRLAIVDHLDAGNEPLPLLLDEVLVNWDPARRARGLDLLASVSRSRQVFLFTCHPFLAREVEERGGRVVELPSPADPERSGR